MDPIDPSLPPSRPVLDLLYERIGRALRRFVSRRAGAPTHEDLVQEAMVRLLQDWPDLVQTAVRRAHPGADMIAAVVRQLTAYLATTVGYESWRQNGGRTREVEMAEGALEAAHAIGPRQGASADLNDLEPRFTRLIDEVVGDETNRAILLSRLNGVPEREVATQLGISVIAVEQRMKRMRKRLADPASELRKVGEQLLDALEGHREATYGDDDAIAIAAQFVPALGQPIELELITPAIRWHRDGFVRATVTPSKPLPDVCLAVAVLGRADGATRLASAPFCLAHGARPTATLEAWIGHPPRSDRSGDGLVVPADHLVVALAC